MRSSRRMARRHYRGRRSSGHSGKSTGLEKAACAGGAAHFRKTKICGAETERAVSIWLAIGGVSYAVLSW